MCQDGQPALEVLAGKELMPVKPYECELRSKFFFSSQDLR